MRTFRDQTGRDWNLSINVGAVKRVRAELQIDLLTVVDPKADLLERLGSDPVLVVDLLYILCKPQADERGISDEQFGEMMGGGDTVLQANRAFLGELADFFPDPVKRRGMTTLIEKMGQLETKALALAERRMAAIDLDQILETAMKSDGEPSTSSPDSSASSPTR